MWKTRTPCGYAHRRTSADSQTGAAHGSYPQKLFEKSKTGGSPGINGTAGWKPKGGKAAPGATGRHPSLPPQLCADLLGSSLRCPAFSLRLGNPLSRLWAEDAFALGLSFAKSLGGRDFLQIHTARGCQKRTSLDQAIQLGIDLRHNILDRHSQSIPNFGIVCRLCGPARDVSLRKQAHSPDFARVPHGRRQVFR